MNDKSVIICRCEDISRAKIHEYLEKGFTNFEDLKRQLRVGMGPCQGQTCGELISTRNRHVSSYETRKCANSKNTATHFWCQTE